MGAQDADLAGVVLDHCEYEYARPGLCDGLEEAACQQGVRLGAEEVGPRAGCAFGRRVDVGVFEDLPHCRRRHLHPEHEQFARARAGTPTRGLLS
jgi:hypothetical protein